MQQRWEALATLPYPPSLMESQSFGRRSTIAKISPCLSDSLVVSLLPEAVAASLQTQKKKKLPSMPELLRLSRSTVEALTGMQRQLIRARERDALLAARVERLASIPGVGRVVALTCGAAQPVITNGFFHGCEAAEVAHLQGSTRVRAARQSERRPPNRETSSCKPFLWQRRNWRRDGARNGRWFTSARNREEIANRVTLAVAAQTGGSCGWCCPANRNKRPD